MPTKGRRTRSQTEILAEQRTRAQTMRDWLRERFDSARKSNRKPPAGAGSGGHGVTLEMKAIKAPEPRWLVRYRKDGTARVSYVNPDRDLKPKRRLRKELRGE